MMFRIVLVACLAVSLCAVDSAVGAAPAPCSSNLFHKEGKCGGAEHGFLRCEKGLWCSQFGFCGDTKEYKVNPICPKETRDNPDVEQFARSPDDPPTPTTKKPKKAPCSSKRYSLQGKCGGKEHNYLRCPKGYWCSSAGFCGTTPEYRQDARCPRETRDDPDDDHIRNGFSPDDQPEDYLPQDDAEGEQQDKGKTNHNCLVGKFHRWGKCGTVGHGNFRCRYGEWCDKDGFCDKFAGAADGALCPKETRPNPDSFEYFPAPDDDPNWVPPTKAKKLSALKKSKSP